MATLIQLRRGLDEQWRQVNPVLAEGEPGFTFDTGELRIGNGINPYTELEPVFTIGYIKQIVTEALGKIDIAYQNAVEMLNTMGSGYPRFCVNSAGVDDNGEPDFLIYNNTQNLLVAKAPVIYTTASGITRDVSSDISLNLGLYSPGAYNVYINYDDNFNFELILLQNSIYKQKAKPQQASEGDIWVNTSVYPNSSYILNEQNEWIETEYVPIGDIVIEVQTPDADEPIEEQQPELT